MFLKINTDHSRFRQIIRGKIKKDLRKFISRGEVFGRKGKDLVSIPMPSIDLPHFEFGDNKGRGIGAGDGQPGQTLGPGEGKEGEGKAGNAEGLHVREVDITLEELAQILGEELGLPRIEPKGDKQMSSMRDRYTGINNIGPQSLLHFKRTYKEALRRQIANGTYDPENPIVTPEGRDERFRTWKTKPVENNNAVIILIMDVSGSMGDEQKEIVRTESFWIDTWLRSQYKGIDTRYIVHDATAREVDRETFFSTRESGGTIISSAYQLADEIIQKHYPASEWNIYPFHFSDGDNWSADDTQKCFQILEQKLLPKSNVFCYGQVESLYGSGQFFRDLKEHFQSGKSAADRVIASRIPNKEAIYDSIKEFLNKGL
ncbi:MAG: DUF444 family protein [Deltaproteobacteria bacterium]|nr:DUF444 family protein [Deltaproteobacteria bacterium]